MYHLLRDPCAVFGYSLSGISNRSALDFVFLATGSFPYYTGNFSYYNCIIFDAFQPLLCIKLCHIYSTHMHLNPIIAIYIHSQRGDIKNIVCLQLRTLYIVQLYTVDVSHLAFLDVLNRLLMTRLAPLHYIVIILCSYITMYT